VEKTVSLPARIRSITADQAGSLWVGTDQGITILDQSTLDGRPAPGVEAAPDGITFGVFMPGEGFACF
jgi:ligand-binding sensor domain-containing protein